MVPSIKPSTYLMVFLLLVFLFCNCNKNEDAVSLPDLETAAVYNVTQTSVTSGGTILTDGGYQVIARGVCWAQKKNPTLKDNFTVDGSGTGAFISEITGLSIGPTYYIRAYATTEKGTAYGNEIVFENLTGKTGTVTDIDGNSYKTIGIGSQMWMAENLRVSRYRNGNFLSYPGHNNIVWSSLSTGAFAWFDNEEIWKVSYGALYNWFAVSNSMGLCPEGWHIPSDEEWDLLINYLGEKQNEVGKSLKSCRQVNSTMGGECNTNEHPRWDASNTHYGTDKYNFGGLPAGFRLYDGFFPNFLGSNSQWWTSTESSTTNEAFARGLSFNSSIFYKEKFNKKFGFSVRCVRDN